MGNAFIAIGAFTWFTFFMITFVFTTASGNNLVERAMQSFGLRLSNSTGPEFGISLLKLTGIIWIAVGILLRITGVAFPRGIFGDVLIGVIILAPVWVGAILAERRKSKGL